MKIDETQTQSLAPLETATPRKPTVALALGAGVGADEIDDGHGTRRRARGRAGIGIIYREMARVYFLVSQDAYQQLSRKIVRH